VLHRLEHGPTRRAVDAERAFLATLGGGCELPVGAHAIVGTDGSISITGLIASVDGQQVYRETLIGRHTSVGRQLAESLLSAGGDDLLPKPE
jgi:hydroxymethylbilane synthase